MCRPNSEHGSLILAKNNHRHHRAGPSSDTILQLDNSSLSAESSLEDVIDFFELIFKVFPSELKLDSRLSECEEGQRKAGPQLPVISWRYAGVSRELDMEPVADADKTVIVSHFHRPTSY